MQELGLIKDSLVTAAGSVLATMFFSGEAGLCFLLHSVPNNSFRELGHRAPLPEAQSITYNNKLEEFPSATESSTAENPK